MPATAAPPTILVTDDNPAGRYATCRALEAAGFATIESSGGAGALELAKTGVAAVVLDVHLPDVHGFEVCRLLRSHPATARLPVVHVSAVHVAAEDRVSGLDAGADAYYVSPVDPAVLAATLRALIRAREQSESVRRSEHLYRGAFEAAPTPMALIDDGGRIAAANAALCALLHCEPGDLHQQALGRLVPPEAVYAVEQARLGWARAPWRGEFAMVTPGAGRVALAWTFVPHAAEPGWALATATPS